MEDKEDLRCLQQCSLLNAAIAVLRSSALLLPQPLNVECNQNRTPGGASRKRWNSVRTVSGATSFIDRAAYGIRWQPTTHMSGKFVIRLENMHS